MAEINEFTNNRAVEVIDEGLRQYMIKVFNYMGAGLCITALVAYIVANTPLLGYLFSVNPAAQTVTYSALGWIVAFAPLIMVFAFNAVITRGSVSATQAMFWGFSAVMGASIASIMILYTATSITRVFLITAITFGGMSLWGYTTKKDLSGMGSFMIMGVWGLIVASIVNIFMKSEGLYYAISYISVIVFTALTAYDMQNIKHLYYSTNDGDSKSRLAVAGALNLYLDFINLFMSLLRVMGDRR